jgi:hypothetical protein
MASTGSWIMSAMVVVLVVVDVDVDVEMPARLPLLRLD